MGAGEKGKGTLGVLGGRWAGWGPIGTSERNAVPHRGGVAMEVAWPPTAVAAGAAAAAAASPVAPPP